jgi:nucleoside-diphosphate-sugar epimerase
VTTTDRLLEAANEAWNVHDGTAAFVLVSSLAAHGPAGPEQPARETDPCRPITAYGRSKLAAEELLATGNWPFRSVVLRPPSLYGPRDTEFLPLFRLARHGWTGRMGTRLRALSLVDGRDAAAAAVGLLETASATGPYFVDDGRLGYTWPDLAEALSVMAERRVRTLTVPLGLLKAFSLLVGRGRAAGSPILNRDRIRDLDSEGWVCDGSRLAADTGFRARHGAAHGFTETLDFYRREGWL